MYRQRDKPAERGREFAPLPARRDGGRDASPARRDVERERSLFADVLVIGAGIAGLMAALRAAELGRRVVVLARGSLAESSSHAAQGGISAALGAEDAPDLHAQDTLRAGRGLCDPAAVEVLAREGPVRVLDLAFRGVSFDRCPGGSSSPLALGLEGGHSRRRIAHASGAETGRVVVERLLELAGSHPRIDLWPAVRVVELRTEDPSGARGRRCEGALAVDARDESRWRITAGATVLATGGAAALYARTTNPEHATGEGMALAWRAGAVLTDMEFVQFHPTALALPGAPALLLSEALRGEGGQLHNRRGERFLARWDERGELAPRDVVARAIFEEMRGSGEPHVWLSMRAVEPEAVRRRFPGLVAACARFGLDLARDLVPVAPAAHYTMGGVQTGLWGETSLEGLFACGEVACTGVHGANRLASNSLLECLVFGWRAGQAAAGAAPAGQAATGETRSAAGAAEPQRATASGWQEESVLSEAHGGDRPSGSLPMEQLRALCWQHLGLVRDEPGLERFLDELHAASAQTSPHHDGHGDSGRSVGSAESGGPGEPGGHEAMAALVAELIARSALLRTESRGAHFRRDHPCENETWQGHLLLRRGEPPRFSAGPALATAVGCTKRPATVR